MSSVSHLHKLACDLAFRCTSADLLRCYVLSLCVNFGAYLINRIPLSLLVDAFHGAHRARIRWQIDF